MDEATSAPLHRWLSFCRMLMLFHPRVGANFYALHAHKREYARLGWNVIHSARGADVPVRYMWIGEESGKLTEKKPDVAEGEMFHIHEDAMPHLEQSHAWYHAKRMAGIVEQRSLGGIPGERVAKVMDHIRAAAQCPLRGIDRWAEEWVERGIDTMKKVARAPEKSVPAFTEPSRAAVLECLNFGLTITQASNVLAVLLRQYAGTPSPLDNTPFVERIRVSADHLIERTITLARERMRMNLTSFYEATYLGLLYGNAALLLLLEISERLPEKSDERRRALYIDEFMAHELAPSLMHPIDLSPCSIVESFHAQHYGIADPSGMYPGAGDQGRGKVNYQVRWPKIQAYSAQAEEVDIFATIDGENSPLHDDESKRLTMFLLALDIGSQTGGATDMS